MTAFKAALRSVGSSDDVAENIARLSAGCATPRPQGASFVGHAREHHPDGADGAAKLAQSYDREAQDPALPVFSFRRWRRN